MRPFIFPLVAVFLLAGIFGQPVHVKAAEVYRSHPPMRPLPSPCSDRSIKEPAYFVDPLRGDDGQDGSLEQPWKTIGRATRSLEAGDTVFLRAGIYYEHIRLSAAGTADAPITVCSYPGELAIVDGGLREFNLDPENSWEPVFDGAPDEFRSVRSFPEYLGPEARREVRVLGHFADSMVPLHGYRNLIDFRSDNEYWNIGNKMNTARGVYVGPGVWYSPESQRIHVRLSHIRAKAYGEDRYRGENDARRLPLVIARPGTPLRIERSKHLRLQNIVVRGAGGTTISIQNCDDVTLDGVTVYGGSPAVKVEGTSRLQIYRSAVRGLSAPWSSRASHKYRGNSPYLLVCGQGNRDFTFAHNEFTDNHDGLTIGTVIGMDFHHNLVENFDDDAIYLNALSTGGDIRIYQNLVKRALSTFAFSGDAKPGRGVYIYRNIFDLRRANYGNPPLDSESPTLVLRPSRVWGDHGSPTWEPMFIYHNTAILPTTEFRKYYGAGWGGHTRGTYRRIFNNIFFHVEGAPGFNFASAGDDVQADGNLHWSMEDGSETIDESLTAFQQSNNFEASKRHYPPGWTANDLIADAGFVRVSADWRLPTDVRLRSDSPAIDAGIELVDGWPDTMRKSDTGRPDVGALPLGVEQFEVGPSSAPRR